MHKLSKIMKRQNELAKKIAAGKASDAEKAEFDKLSQVTEALANPENVDVGKTKLTTMTLGEFKAYAEKEEAEAYEDPARLALLKQNITSVKEQGKTEPEDHVAVKVAVKVDGNDRLDAVEAKLDAVLDAIKGFDGRTSTGVSDNDAGDGNGAGDGDTGGDDLNKQDGDKPAATALANEAIDSIISQFESLKKKIADGGTFTKDEIYELWPGYEVRNVLEGAIEILSKLETAKTLIEEVTPKLEELAKKDTAKGDDKGDAGDKGKGKGDDDKDEDDDKGDDDDKSTKGSLLLSGNDMSPPLTAKEQHQVSKSNKLF